jgi:hypothetical protein
MFTQPHNRKSSSILAGILHPIAPIWACFIVFFASSLFVRPALPMPTPPQGEGDNRTPQAKPTAKQSWHPATRIANLLLPGGEGARRADEGEPRNGDPRMAKPVRRYAVQALQETDPNTPPSSSPAPAPARPAYTLANIPDATNIHHQVQYCILCHEKEPNGPIASAVRFGNDLKAGCRCHYNDPGDLRHPTDVAMPQAMLTKNQPPFPLRDGKITCVSCHSFAVLCARETPNISSLRGAPYPDRTAFCFKCHDEKQYERLNPHNQRDKSGNIVEEKCLFCHIKKPDEASATFASVKVIGNLEMLCQGCHNISDRHPAGKPHFVKPTLEYQVRMRTLERQYGIVLPVDENGKITCITCHNPHEALVIPSALPGSKGAGENLRHRLPKNLCSECHWHTLATPGREK